MGGLDRSTRTVGNQEALQGAHVQHTLSLTPAVEPGDATGSLQVYDVSGVAARAKAMGLAQAVHKAVQSQGH